MDDEEIKVEKTEAEGVKIKEPMNFANQPYK